MRPKPSNHRRVSTRLLLATGFLTLVCGVGLTIACSIAWRFGFLAAGPGLVMIGYGANLMYGGAFPDEVDIRPGKMGFPFVTRRVERHPNPSPPGAGTTGIRQPPS